MVSISQQCQLSYVWYNICIPAMSAISCMIWYLYSNTVKSFVYDTVYVFQHCKVSHAWYWMQQHHTESTITPGAVKAKLSSSESHQLHIQSFYDVNQAIHSEFGHPISRQWLSTEIWCLIVHTHDCFALNHKVTARETIAVHDTMCCSHEKSLVCFKHKKTTVGMTCLHHIPWTIYTHIILQIHYQLPIIYKCTASQIFLRSSRMCRETSGDHFNIKLLS